VGFIASFLIGNNLNEYVIVVSSYVVPSLLPSLFIYLTNLFRNSKKNNDVVEYQTVNKVPLTDDDRSEINEKEIDFILTNENGKVLLDIKTNKIICFEANDNYAVTYYINDKGEVKKSMERISLKKIEDMLRDISVLNFERVHKSYLINTSFVKQVTGKAQAYKLEMSMLQFKVPVSRSFKIASLK